MNYWRWLIGLGGLWMAVAAGWMLSSCAHVERTVVAPPHIEGADFVGNQTCVDCHPKITRQFPASPHARFHREENPHAAGWSGCESCHGPGSRHVKEGGGRGVFIVNPGKDPQACMECHLEVHAAFKLPHRHPVMEDHMNCVQCHDPHGSDIMNPAGGLAMARLNESCAQCHRDQTRPFIYEHEALQEGCTVCHQPHGSINRKLLTERGPNLCLKCHSQVQSGGDNIIIGKQDHSQYLQMGTCWSAGCHTAVHGSNFNPKMLY